MSQRQELYQQLIIDHGRRPRNFGVLPGANYSKEGFNPLCGDQVTVYILLRAGVIDDIKFDGSGCVISMASASLMTQALRGQTLETAKRIFEDFHEVIVNHASEPVDRLGKLAVLRGVSEYPARVKCATLCWHTVMAALTNNSDPISTEESS